MANQLVLNIIQMLSKSISVSKIFDDCTHILDHTKQSVTIKQTHQYIHGKNMKLINGYIKNMLQR